MSLMVEITLALFYRPRYIQYGGTIMNIHTNEKRVRINRTQRNQLEEDIGAFKMVSSMIKNAYAQKIPKKSVRSLEDSLKNLEDLLHKDGLPDYRIDELKAEMC
jgi:hypothetical protein